MGVVSGKGPCVFMVYDVVFDREEMVVELIEDYGMLPSFLYTRSRTSLRSSIHSSITMETHISFSIPDPIHGDVLYTIYLSGHSYL
jgi:hypothetical protein